MENITAENINSINGWDHALICWKIMKQVWAANSASHFKEQKILVEKRIIVSVNGIIHTFVGCSETSGRQILDYTSRYRKY